MIWTDDGDLVKVQLTGAHGAHDWVLTLVPRRLVATPCSKQLITSGIVMRELFALSGLFRIVSVVISHVHFVLHLWVARLSGALALVHATHHLDVLCSVGCEQVFCLLYQVARQVAALLCIPIVLLLAKHGQSSNLSIKTFH